MDTKICTKCGEEKPATTEYFYRNRAVKCGLTSKCRACCAETNKSWRERHPDRQQLASKNWLLAHPDRRKRATKRWRDANPDARRASSKAWAAANRDKKNGYYMRRYREDPAFRLSIIIRARLKGALIPKVVRGPKTLALLGGGIEDTKKHLEKQFAPGMSWATSGKWHVDHLIPLRGRVGGVLIFNLSSPEDARLASNYRNLAPVWGPDNQRKSNRVPHWDDIPKELQDICTPRIRDLLKKVKKTA